MSAPWGPAAQAPGPDDRGFLYGDGLFETIHVQASTGGVRWLGDHLERLRRSGQALSFSAEQIERAASCLVWASTQAPGLWRVTMTRDDPEADWGGQGGVWLRHRPWVFPERPRLGLVGGYLPQDSWAEHKTTSYLRWVMARRAARASGWDDGVMVSACGLVGESSAANLFLWFDEEGWVTPQARGLLPGVTRQGLLRAAAQRRYSVRERPVSVHELAQASEIVLCSAGLGVVAAASLQGRPLQARHAASLSALLSHGRSPER